MAIFNKSNLKVEEIKNFLKENEIEWDGGVIDAFSSRQQVYMNIDDKTLNKIAKRPIRLLINSEKYKDIDITTAHISKKDFILFNLQNKNGEVLDLSKKWQEFKHKIEELENMQQMGA